MRAHPDCWNWIEEALGAALDDGRPADRVLERFLRKRPALSREERAFTARAFLSICWMRGRLDYLSGVPGLERVPNARRRLAAWLVLEEHLEAEVVAASLGLDPGPLERLLHAPRDWPEEPVERLAAERSLPHWLAQLWAQELGAAEADALAATTNCRGPITVRANRLRCRRDELAAALTREGVSSSPTQFAPDGLHLEGRPNIFGLQCWRDGWFEVQDEASQLVVEYCAAAPDARCLDLCAGSGGKALALAARLTGGGELIACDVAAPRLADLRARAARAGASCVRVALLDDVAVDEGGGRAAQGARDAAAPPAPRGSCEVVLDAGVGRAAHGAQGVAAPPVPRESCDVVLVDAPCSSLGSLRRGPDARWRIEESELARWPGRQLRILERAAEYVRPGGRLVYATCTVHRAENEGVAQAFASRAGRFSPVPPSRALGPDLARLLGAEGAEHLVLLPHRHGTDGFFCTAWERPSTPRLRCCARGERRRLLGVAGQTSR